MAPAPKWLGVRDSGLFHGPLSVDGAILAGSGGTARILIANELGSGTAMPASRTGLGKSGVRPGDTSARSGSASRVPRSKSTSDQSPS